MSNLCLFLRAPNLGQVKTRLAASIGEREALAAHIRLVDHAIAQLSPAVRPNDFPELALWFADTRHGKPTNAAVAAELQTMAATAGR